MERKCGGDEMSSVSGLSLTGQWYIQIEIPVGDYIYGSESRGERSRLELERDECLYSSWSPGIGWEQSQDLSGHRRPGAEGGNSPASCQKMARNLTLNYQGAKGKRETWSVTNSHKNNSNKKCYLRQMQLFSILGLDRNILCVFSEGEKHVTTAYNYVAHGGSLLDHSIMWADYLVLWVVLIRKCFLVIRSEEHSIRTQWVPCERQFMSAFKVW